MSARLACTAALLLASVPSLAADAAPPKAAPFTGDEDADGARSVWLILQESGLPYEYVPAKDLRASPHFQVDPKGAPTAGAVAWWPSRVGIVFLDKTVRTMGFSEKLSDLEARLGPVTILDYVKDPPRRTRRVEFRRFGARIVATVPDAYVWREPRQFDQPRLAFLQIYRRELRLPDGSDADASFGFLLEKLDGPRTARAYAEALRGRALTRGARLTEEHGLVFLRKDCEGGPCRLEVSVRVEGDVGVQTACVYHRAVEPAVKPDCAAWLASTVASPAPRRPPDPSEPLVTRGGRKLDDGDPAAALEDFRAARARDPANAFAWSEEAAALAHMREWPACVTAATAALERQPDRVEALATRASCLAHQEKVEDALADLDAALALEPFAPAYVSRALLRDQLGNAEGARADAEQVGRLAPALAPRVERLLKD